ncbi:hypothetical protein ACFQ1T_14080 [Methylophilus glucosoxydans]|uniref:DUF4145 domain-containing protein n=1 Tax=Methylophilus glucosoxydans TaxID=752553 RepID=A0ABW3GQI6_9PROT
MEIARRQIETASELLLDERDFLAVVTLAGAAEEILGSLLRRKGQLAMIDHLVNLDKRQFGGRPFAVLNKEVNGNRNALKHANDPQEDTIEIEAGEAIAMLSRAIVNYALLNNAELTPIMILVYEYLNRLYPDDAP